MWHQIDIAFDSSNAANFYLDGQSLGKITGLSPAFTNSQPLDIGRNPIIDNDGSWQYFTGGIDEVSIYNRVLSSAEIAQHHSFATPEPSSLVLTLLGGGALALWRNERKNGRRQANRTLTASEATS